MRHAAHVVTLTLAGLASLAPATPAHAGLLDSLFGSGTAKANDPARPARGQREWLIRDYTTVRLVPREAASTPNQQPVRLNAEALRQQLGRVQFTAAGAADEQPLFTPAELAELAEPLVHAFENAGPDDDVLLLSSARRAGLLAQPYAVTARLFAQNGNLQMIVNDTRYEFYNQAVGSRTAPVFTFGSRGRAGRAVLKSDSASTPRADWVAMPIGSAAAAPAVAAPPVGVGNATGRTAAAAPVGAAPVGAAPVSAAPVGAVPTAPIAAAANPALQPAPAARPRDAAFGEELEQRLLTLKRLREKGLVTEDEYQQKRREILSQL